MPTTDRSRAVDIAATHLRQQVIQGVWEPASRLPPERALAAELGISRLTLRSALSKLEAEGLTKARQGQGVTVQDWRRTGSVGLLAHLVREGGLGWLPSFLELRRAVAIELLGMVTEKATDAELDALALLAAEVAAAPTRAVLMEGNLRFTAAVVALGDNIPLQLLFNTLANAFVGRDDVQSALIADEDAVRASFPLVVGLLRSRDPVMVREAARTALTAIDSATLAKLEMSA